MSPLIREGNGLLRVGSELAGAQSCCCDSISRDAYSDCGHRCALRVTNGPIDSEMATCGENIPDGWEVNRVRACEGLDNRGSNVAPFIVAVKSDACGDSPVALDETENQGLPNCSETRSAGIDAWRGDDFLLGASVQRRYSGFRPGTYFQDDSIRLLRYEQVNLLSNMGFQVRCRTPFGSPICRRCGRFFIEPQEYIFRAFMQITVSEHEYDSQNISGNKRGWRQITRGLYYDTSTFGDGAVFKDQPCAEKSNFSSEGLSKYTPGGLGLPQRQDALCEVYRYFYPDSPTTFEISVDGIVANGQNFGWSLSEETDWATDGVNGYDITPEIPSELESFDPIVLYLGKGCCTEDYCNPLP